MHTSLPIRSQPLLKLAVVICAQRRGTKPAPVAALHRRKQHVRRAA